MRIWRALKVLAPMFVLLLAALPGFGQVDYSTATLKGTVLDVQGGGVPGATVTISNAATGLSKTQKSGSEGGYLFPLLPIGSYQVEVTATGFDKAVAKDVQLTVGEAAIVDIHMTVGTANVTVEVTSQAPLIQTEQVQQANEINQTQIDLLPNVNRSFDTYVQSLPGISDAAAVHDSGSQRAIGAFPVNAFTTAGGNGRGGLVTIDGGENDYGSGITRTYFLPVDAIQEFQVNRNGYNAEYGFSYNEAVAIVTKSGTNTLHGAAFATYRNNNTDAGQYFQPLGPGGGRLFDQNTHLGGNLGGAIIKDKLFFFAAYEGFQTAFKSNTNFLNNAQILAPTEAQTNYINAIIAQGGSCGAESCAALAANLTTALTPINNKYVQGLIGAPGNAFGLPNQSGTFINRDTWNDGVIHIDWQPNSSNSITLRGLAETEVNPAAFGGSEYGHIANLPPNATTAADIRDFEVVGAWTHIFSPTLFNALRVQAVPEYIANVPYVASTGGTTVPFNIIAGTGSLGSFGPVIGSFPGYESREKRFEFEDSISWTHGTHSFKFGASYRPAKYDISNGLYAHSQIVYLPGLFNLYGLGGPTCALAGLFALPGPGCGGAQLGLFTPAVTAADLSAINTFNGAPGSPNFDLFAAAPLNSVQSFEGVLPVQFRTSFGNPTFVGWGHYGGVYAQDSWKVVPRLTINVGIRFDVNAEPFPTGDTQTFCSPFPPVTKTVTVTTTCTGPAPTGVLRTFQTNPPNGETFYTSPRIGLAWDITGDHKTLLRASGGAYVGASELQVVYYSHLYNPNGNNLVQEEITLGQDPGYFGLIVASAANGNLPVLPPTLTDYQEGVNPNAGQPGQPHGVIITQGDRPCGGPDPFGCGTYRSAYSTQGGISIQRELEPNLSLEVGYNFQQTFHIQDPRETNFQQAVSTPTDPSGPGIPLVDPYLGPMLVPINPNVETGTLYCSCGSATYHGMTASLTRRYTNHLQFQVNYTYSRSVDDVLDFSSFNSSFYPTLFPDGNGNNQGKDRGQSAYNLKHILAGNAVYTTPFETGKSLMDTMLADISISPIVTIHSGIPFQVLINPGQGLAGECSTVIECEQGDATSNGLVQEALNQARPFNAPRNSGIGPWNFRWDMSVRKGIYINKERGLRLDVIANVANILNHTNFLGVNGVFSQAQAASAGAGADAVPLLPINGQPPQFVNLLNGPYGFKGIKAFNTEEKASNGLLPLGADPLAFVSADVPRQAQFQLKLSF
jgi:Carboxypeptidase regulatory-like domain